MGITVGSLHKSILKAKPHYKLSQKLNRIYEQKLDGLTQGDKAELTLLRNEYQRRASELGSVFQKQSREYVRKFEIRKKEHNQKNEDLAVVYMKKEIDLITELTGSEYVEPWYRPYEVSLKVKLRFVQGFAIKLLTTIRIFIKRTARICANGKTVR